MVRTGFAEKPPHLKDYQQSSSALYFNPTRTAYAGRQSGYNKEDIFTTESTPKCLIGYSGNAERYYFDEWDAFLDKKNRAED
ncbi:hypothetical protein OH492_27400 [Vibrio chagasii]|nr:hypothetical protein [Vibrio chagasii]